MWPTPEEFLISWVGEDKPTDSEETIQYWLDRAEVEALSVSPNLENLVFEGKVNPAKVKTVIISAVNRVFRNPGMIRSYQESMGTGSITGQASTSFAGSRLGELYFSPDEIAALRGKSRKRSAFSVIPGGK